MKNVWLKYIFLHSVDATDVEAFARAMQGSKGEKKDDDEDMSLD